MSGVQEYTDEGKRNWKRAKGNPSQGYTTHPAGRYAGRLNSVEVREASTDGARFLLWRFLTIGGEADGQNAVDMTGVDKFPERSMGRFAALGYDLDSEVPDDPDDLDEFCEKVTRDAPTCEYDVVHNEYTDKKTGQARTGINITVIADSSVIENDDAEEEPAPKKKAAAAPATKKAAVKKDDYTAEELEAFIKGWGLKVPKESKGDLDALKEFTGSMEIDEESADEDDMNLIGRLPKSARPKLV